MSRHEIRILDARVFHARLRPRKNRFRYGALYLLIPLEALASPARHHLFSVDRANLFSIRTRDYGDGVTSPQCFIRRILEEWNLTEADGDVWLMTMPRIFGYAFNPVSFWFCFDQAQGLRAVLAEVNNTFGERHFYLCFHDTHGAIAPHDRLPSRKMFHVSPFIEVEGDYSFRFSAAGKNIAVAIDLSDSQGVLLQTSVAGSPERLSSMRLMRALISNPLHPLKVIALIHYQAVKLFLKGIRHFHKPPPPAVNISH